VRQDRLRDAADALDGLLRVAYQQGQRQIGWDELCSFCEDAVVASGLHEGEMDPWMMQARVAVQSTQLAVRLALHGRPEGLAWPASPLTGGCQFSLLALLRTLHGLHQPSATGREAA
jgi:hypothetical protein